eukprot:tig00020780_g13782.t1
MKEALSKIERDFILQALREGGQRLDGRRPFDYRKIRITFGTDTGLAEVQLGQTRVTAVVSAEIVEPYPDRPTEGFLSFNVELSPMAHPSFEPGRPSEFAVELGRIIERGLREARAIDTEGLCIVAGKKVWSVRCDMHVMDHGGNLIDCTQLALVLALLHFRRPVVSVVGESVMVYATNEREPIPLTLHHVPLSVTFAFFEDGEQVVVDPSTKEELAADGRMTITMNAQREICCVQKSGGSAITAEQMIRCVKIAAVKVSEISKIVNQNLQAADRSAAQKRPRKPLRVPGAGGPACTNLTAGSAVAASEAAAAAAAAAADAEMADADGPAPPPAIPVPKAAAGDDMEALFYGQKSQWEDKEEKADPQSLQAQRRKKKKERRRAGGGEADEEGSEEEEGDTATLHSEFAPAPAAPAAAPAPSPRKAPVPEPAPTAAVAKPAKTKKAAAAMEDDGELDLAAAVKKKPAGGKKKA